MRRKQLYLDEASDRALKRLAARTGHSEAYHVREALRRYLESQPEWGDGDDRDPLARLIGLVDDRVGPTDVAANHDHYLYGVPKDRR